MGNRSTQSNRMNYPDLSIIIPTCNRSNYLQQCLNSIVAQNYPRLEIIITDDNSTDDTESVCAFYIRQYPFIKYFKNSQYPKGPNGNKNNGLDHATGELLGILDDDDTLTEGALILLIQKIEEGYDVALGNCHIVTDGKNSRRFSGVGISESGEISYQDYLCGKLSGEFWAVFKAERLRDKRFETDLYGGEGILWKELHRKAKVYYLHQAVRNYTIHENSATRSMLENAGRAIRNYEKDIEYFGDEMKYFCPCHLAMIYRGAALFARLSLQYKKTFSYLLESLLLCPQKKTILQYFLSLLPKKLIIWLLKLGHNVKNR